MISYSSTINIAAGPEAVWQVLAAVTAWQEWLPTVTAVHALDGMTLAVGARFRIRQPGLPTAVWTVSRLEPPTRFDWTCRAPGLVTIASHVIAATHPQRSHLHLGLDLSGSGAHLVACLIGQYLRRALSIEAKCLRRRCEHANHRTSEPPGSHPCH